MKENEMIRIGYGYDVHRLVEDRKLILGGVEIPFEKGLQGHSDADVLVHAVCDALLGAAGLEDIGFHFPDDSPLYKNIYSIELLRRCGQMLTAEGFSLVNLDAVLVAQAPKIAPYRKQMREKMADALDCHTDQINIKATTSEELGVVGTGQGMAAMCTALIALKA
jgi:2-C-methyl-D-erythritol 2,4-cyclodiphosphate synthase